MNKTRRGGRLPGAAALIALVLLALGALLIAGAGPAYRTGLLSLGDAFATLRYGVYGGVAAAGLGLFALVVASWYGRIGPALVGGVVIVGAVALVAVPFLHWQRAQQVPPIHDITTDTDDPPRFVALAAAREKAPNAVAYPGQATARQQREAYPDIGPLRLDASLRSVREAARAVVMDFGWALAAVTENSIEATATTSWFGFRDDVVIRFREVPDGVRIDVRSASRLGRSDVGTNAARIRAFLQALQHRAE